MKGISKCVLRMKLYNIPHRAYLVIYVANIGVIIYWKTDQPYCFGVTSREGGGTHA